jgi:predicted RNase H-like nuclease (RuvC/YqgF family)
VNENMESEDEYWDINNIAELRALIDQKEEELEDLKAELGSVDEDDEEDELKGEIVELDDEIEELAEDLADAIEEASDQLRELGFH